MNFLTAWQQFLEYLLVLRDDSRPSLTFQEQASSGSDKRSALQEVFMNQSLRAKIQNFMPEREKMNIQLFPLSNFSNNLIIEPVLAQDLSFSWEKIDVVATREIQEGDLAQLAPVTSLEPQKEMSLLDVDRLQALSLPSEVTEAQDEDEAQDEGFVLVESLFSVEPPLSAEPGVMVEYPKISAQEIKRQELMDQACLFSKLAYNTALLKGSISPEKKEKIRADLARKGYPDFEQLSQDGYSIYLIEGDSFPLISPNSVVKAGINHPGGIGVIFAKGHEISISFRGTKIAEDVLVDLFAILQQSPDHTGRVHQGFSALALNLRDPIEAIIKDYCLSKSLQSDQLHISLVGHSLGGAIALLTANWMCQQHTWNVKSVVTLGAPRPYDHKAAVEASVLFEQKGIDVIFMEQEGDPVPRIAFGALGFSRPVGLCYRLANIGPIHKVDGYKASFDRGLFWLCAPSKEIGLSACFQGFCYEDAQKLASLKVKKMVKM